MRLMKQKVSNLNCNIVWLKTLILSRITKSKCNYHYRQVEHVKKSSMEKFASEIITVQDVFKNSLGSFESVNLENTDDAGKLKIYNELVKNIIMTQNIMEKTFKKFGIEEFNPLGEKFDPNVHEATFEFQDPSKTPGTIGDVSQTGYKIGKRILRAPKVGIVKKSSK